MNEQDPHPKKNNASSPVNKSSEPVSKGNDIPMPDKKERKGAESTEAEKEQEKTVSPKSVKGDHGASQPPTNPGPQGIH